MFASHARRVPNYSQRVIPIQQVVPNALAIVLRNAPLTKEKVEFAWRTAVGMAVANATSVELIRGTLTVEARSGHWQREINRARPTILSRLTAVLGDAVSALEVRVVPESPDRAHHAPRRSTNA